MENADRGLPLLEGPLLATGRCGEEARDNVRGGLEGPRQESPRDHQIVIGIFSGLQRLRAEDNRQGFYEVLGHTVREAISIEQSVHET